MTAQPKNTKAEHPKPARRDKPEVELFNPFEQIFRPKPRPNDPFDPYLERKKRKGE